MATLFWGINMDKNSYITVNLRHKEEERFARFMQITTEALQHDARVNVDYYSKQNGEKLERVVLDMMRSHANKFDINPDNIRPTLKQHFPDILFGNNFGVEVKSTKENSWISTGSSIVESLREEQVRRIYLMFGRLSAPNIDFRCKPYEDCLYDIAVTHSPRYLINMDLTNNSQTIFGKMQINYDSFRDSKNQIEIVRNYYREKFHRNNKKGEMPWWISSESNTTLFEPPTLQENGLIRMWDIIDASTQEYLKACANILFPEILGTSTIKYQGLALWLCSRYSIITSSLRDKFSAGGKGNIYINGKLKWGNMPKIICNLLVQINTIRDLFEHQSDVYNEIQYYASYFKADSDSFEEWKRQINYYLKAYQINIEDILSLTFVKVTENDFFAEN